MEVGTQMKTRMAQNMTFGIGIAAAAIVVLAGCQGQGQYTKQFREQQTMKMAGLKAATGWDMAHQQYLSGDLKKSLKTIDESIELSSRVARSHTLRGRILLEQGNLESALKSFDTAVEIDPEFVDAHYFRGIVLERFTRFEQAMACYKTAGELDETNPQYAVAWAEMLIQLDRFDEALNLLESKRDSFENNAGIRQTLGHISMMQGDTYSAMEHFREATLLAPDDDGLVEDLARANMSAGQYAEADQLLRRLIDTQSDTQRRDLLHLRAQCLSGMDQLVPARLMLIQLTKDEAGQNDAPAWYALGRVCLGLNDHKSVRDAANRLISISPTSHHGYLLMALFQQQRGDLDRAVKTLDRAAQLTMNDPEPLLVQAVLFERLDKHDLALQAAEQALEIDPESQEALALVTALNSGSDVLRLTEVPVND